MVDRDNPLSMSLRQFLALLADDKPKTKRLRRSLANELRRFLDGREVREAMIAHLSDQAERIEYDPKLNYAKWVPDYGYYVACVAASKAEARYIDMKTNGKPSYTNKHAHSAMARRRAAKIARTFYGD